MDLPRRCSPIYADCISGAIYFWFNAFRDETRWNAKAVDKAKTLKIMYSGRYARWLGSEFVFIMAFTAMCFLPSDRVWDATISTIRRRLQQRGARQPQGDRGRFQAPIVVFAM